MSNAVVPLNQLQRRAPEAGRIRLGVKTARAMKSIDTFRFTSPHKDAIEQLAAQYGGTPAPWSDPKAPDGQWEVISTSSTIDIFVQPDGLSTWYEMWSGGGCQRRCDGITVQVPGPQEMMTSPCICAKAGKLECRPYTRLNVVLPAIDFFGVWRMETKGWNAAKELPGMFDMVVELAQRGRMVRATLSLEQRKSVQNGKTKNFVVPVIAARATPEELLAGGGVARPSLDAAPPGTNNELTAGPAPTVPDEDDDGIIEAQVIDVELENQLEDQIRTIATQHDLDPDAVVASIWQQTDGDYGKLGRFIERNDEGKSLAWTKNRTLTWRA